LVLLALTALPLAAQGGFGPPPVNRDPRANPIHPDSYPAYIRRDAATNPAILRIWDEGMNRSQAMALMQVLTDPLGQRMTGSPQSDAAQDWVIGKYREWGVPARKERYGTWQGWSRGVTHVDLIAPRVRSLEAMALAYSPGTGGRPVEGEVITYPMDVMTPEAFDAGCRTCAGRSS
jgi:hypothetical protein